MYGLLPQYNRTTRKAHTLKTCNQLAVFNANQSTDYF